MRIQSIHKHALAACVAVGAMLGSGAALAEAYGLPNARLANPGNMPTLSVEGAFNTGDDYQHIGTRINYRTSDQLTVFGDFGLSEIGDSSFDIDGTSFGVGAFYFLPDQRILEGMDVAAKGSFHSISLEGDEGFFGTREFEGTIISIEALVSGQQPISDNGLSWYGNIGFHIGGGDFDDNEVGFGGGVILPMSFGEVYGGVDHIDELIFGVGFRFFL